MAIRRSTQERVKQDIVNGLKFGPVDVKVERVAHTLLVIIPEQTTAGGKKLPAIVVRRKGPAKLVKATHRSIKDALAG